MMRTLRVLALLIIPLPLLGISTCTIVKDKDEQWAWSQVKRHVEVEKLKESLERDWVVVFEIKRSELEIFYAPLTRIHMLVKAPTEEDAVSEATKHLKDIMMDWSVAITFVYDAQLRKAD